MPKYFFNPVQMIGSEMITIMGETAHHLIHVLRMTEGESVTLCDGANTDYMCETASITKRGKEHIIIFNVHSTSSCDTELPVYVTLYQALPKGDKLDLIIQKCVELGVAEIVPVATCRSVAKLKDVARKTERYQRIAESAAGQSMRGVVPTVRPAIPFTEALKSMNGFTIAAYEEEKTQTIQAVVGTSHKRINIWIGPEGGWAKEEIETLTGCGAITVSLGRRILRTETAAIATIAQLALLVENTL